MLALGFTMMLPHNILLSHNAMDDVNALLYEFKVIFHIITKMN